MSGERNIVIGGGQAGGRAIQAMRRAGFAGEIVLIGDERHLPYERPPLSKDFLLKGSAAKMPTVLDQAYADENQITLKLGAAAVGIDRANQRVALSDGSDVAYDRLLLATGARLRRLALPGSDRPNVLYLRTLDDSLAIESYLKPDASILVIGGGFIGLEVAAAARARGAKVTVLEAAPKLLLRMGVPPVSDFVLRYHRSLGIDIKLETFVLEIEADDRVRAVTLSNGERLATDLVVVGIGIDPETKLASEAGLEVKDGIITDEYAVTSDPKIFAAGDCTRHFNPRLGRQLRLESWQNAQMQAETAGKGMAGERVAYDGVPWIWSDQNDLNIQVAGAPDKVTDLVTRGDVEKGEFALFQYDGDRLVGGITVNFAREMPIIRRMLASDKAFPKDQCADATVKLRDLLK
jgi:NADPH-dependent 2,4-dienoyl-CoA reductase/sulfur reductase-like enzyme